MNRFIALLFFIVVALFLQRQLVADQRKSENKFQRAISSDADSCANKERCFLVYVTPWCPSCQQLKPHFALILARRDSVPGYGVKVVVGEGRSAGDNEREAATLPGAVTDDGRDYLRHYQIREFPSAVLLDSGGGEVLRGTPAMQKMFDTFLRGN